MTLYEASQCFTITVPTVIFTQREQFSLLIYMRLIARENL